MPQAMPLTSKIADTSEMTYSYKIISCPFGDGYTQASDDGINNRVENWSVDYIGLLATDRNTVINTFDLVKGADYLTWTSPGNSVSKKYRILSVTQKHNTIYFFISVKLIQIF